MPLPWNLCCVILSLSILLSLEIQTTSSVPDSSFHLHSILKNHSAYACENDILNIACPPRTSVAVLSVFYGPTQHLCLSASTNNTLKLAEDTQCTSTIAVEKVRAECQDRRSCHISVLNQVFGEEPCPFTIKYLLVTYKCQPEHHRTKLVCENERLRLLCKNSTVLAIYSATFGHLLHGSPNCSQEPGSHTDMECLSSTALKKVWRRCHGRESCSIVADVVTFGDPCFPGTRKHLRVSFTCVPWFLLQDVGHGSTDQFMISDYTHDFPEKVALYFVSGICAGLIFLLCLFGLRWTLIRDVKQLVTDFTEWKSSHEHSKNIMDDFSDEEISDNSSICCLTKSDCANDMDSSILTIHMDEHEVQQRELPRGDMWPHQDCSPALSTITRVA